MEIKDSHHLSTWLVVGLIDGALKLEAIFDTDDKKYMVVGWRENTIFTNVLIGWIYLLRWYRKERILRERERERVWIYIYILFIWGETKRGLLYWVWVRPSA